MQGNFGPEDKMHTAIAAYTPNTPWAEMGCGDVASMNGGETSSAMPQVAAAALWCQHQPSPPNIERWQRAEAVRHALFTSVDKSPPNRFEFFGQGLLRARDALEVVFDTSRPKARKDNVWFPLLNLLTGFDELSIARRRMLEVEAAQLAASSPELIEVLPDPIPMHEAPQRLCLSATKPPRWLDETCLLIDIHGIAPVAAALAR